MLGSFSNVCFDSLKSCGGIISSSGLIKSVQADSELVYSPVAQLVERLTVNQLVAGSSPARGARHLFPNQSKF